MPRKNCNADYHRIRDNFSKIVFFDEAPMPARKPTGLKIDAETIIREFRKNWQEKEGRVVPLNPRQELPKSEPERAWWRAINWPVALEWAYWIALAACMVYLAIFVFGPFISGMRHE
jgi:hypothetical protein